MHQFWLQPTHIQTHHFHIHTAPARLYAVIPVHHIYQTLIAYLELAFQLPFIPYGIRYACQSGIWFQAKLRSVHQCSRKDIWLHSASLGVVFSADSAILVNLSDCNYLRQRFLYFRLHSLDHVCYTR